MKKTSENRLSDRITFGRAIQYEYCEMLSGRFVNGLRAGEGLDISDGGIGLRSRRRPKFGEVLKLYVPIDAVQTSLPVYAQVVWVKAMKDYFQAGVRFLA
jgi:hypothetical protein